MRVNEREREIERDNESVGMAGSKENEIDKEAEFREARV